MKINWKELLNRFKNKGTVMAFIGFAIIILRNFGVEVDEQKTFDIADALCGMLMLIGWMNNPSTPGIS